MESGVFVLPEDQLQEINLAYPGNTELCSIIKSHVRQQLERNSLKDVSLHSGGKVTKIHSWQLSLWSPLFRSLVTETDPYQSRQSIDILLPEFSHLDLQLFSEFLYTGELGMKQRQLGKMKALLKIFRISLVLEVFKVEHKLEPSGVEEVSEIQDESDQEPSEDIVLWELSNPNEPARSIQCDKCSRLFHSIRALNAHMQTQHFGASRHQCELCRKVFATKETLSNHKKSHTGEYHVCKCGKKFVCERDLADHMNIHTGEKVFLCSVCGETFQTRKKMLNHKEKHKRSKQPCPICGALLKSKASYAAHVKSHNQEKIHTCKHCSKSFKRNYDLKIHMRGHTGAKPYTCEECNKQFSLSSTLSKHKRLFHANKAAVIYPCGTCSQNFNSRQEADAHQQEHHLGAVQENIMVNSSTDFSTVVSSGADLGSVVTCSELNSGELNAAESSSIARLVEIGIPNMAQPLYVKFS